MRGTSRRRRHACECVNMRLWMIFGVEATVRQACICEMGERTSMSTAIENGAMMEQMMEVGEVEFKSVRRDSTETAPRQHLG